MRAVIQRVSSAAVRVDGDTVGEIGAGLLVLLGVAPGDGEVQVHWLARKIAGLRVFERQGRMDASLLDLGGEALVVSQFTLYGDCRKGRRPSFTHAAPPELAEPLYASFCDALRDLGVPVSTGRFGAQMEVYLINDGPVTLSLEAPGSPAPGSSPAPLER